MIPRMLTPPREITFDRLAPYPALMSVRTAAEAGDWAGVRAAYDTLTTWDMRTAAARTVGETAGAEQFLSPAAEPEGAVLARTMLAYRHIEIGWTARTDARASQVTRKQFATLHDHLRRAEQLLIDVTARDPGNLAAWTFRLVTARGLELGQSEARRRWDQIARHDPHHLAGQVQLLEQLCPKWGGTLEGLHEFTRDRAAAASPGALNPVLVVDAHLAHWHTLDGKERSAYLSSPAVRESVAWAAAHSVLHPSFRPAYNWVAAHCSFAMYHSVVGDWRAAAVHFRAMGPYALTEPWSYFFGNATGVFHKHRAAALAKG